MFNGFHVSSIAISLMIALSITGCAHNSNKAPAIEAVEKSTTVETVPTPPAIAIDELEAQCESGYADACYEAGVAHLNGHGTPKSLQKAAQFFNWGCEGQSMASCNDLGMLQIRNEGPDSVGGYARITLGCEGGYGKACANLGYIYNTGFGVDVDVPRGLDYYVKGCDLENGPACLEAGVAYLTGLPETNDPDTDKGLALLSSGCDAVHVESCLVGGLYIARGNEDVDPDLVAALPWYEKVCGGASVKCAGLGDAFVAPNATHRVTPVFPLFAKESGIKEVELEYIFHVGADGKLKFVHGVTTSSIYDSHIINALKQWTFEPATLDGAPIDWIWPQTFIFRLD